MQLASEELLEERGGEMMSERSIDSDELARKVEAVIEKTNKFSC